MLNIWREIVIVSHEPSTGHLLLVQFDPVSPASNIAELTRTKINMNDSSYPFYCHESSLSAWDNVNYWFVLFCQLLCKCVIIFCQVSNYYNRRCCRSLWKTDQRVNSKVGRSLSAYVRTGMYYLPVSTNNIYLLFCQHIFRRLLVFGKRNWGLQLHLDLWIGFGVFFFIKEIYFVWSEWIETNSNFFCTLIKKTLM